MEKKIRKAVRTFLIKNNKIVYKAAVSALKFDIVYRKHRLDIFV